jgi:hypothetical protein
MTPTEIYDLTGQNDDLIARSLKAAGDTDLNELQHAWTFWNQEAVFARKRANAISARMDEIRGT